MDTESSVSADRADRSALQDPPPRCLILYASDAICASEEEDDFGATVSDEGQGQQPAQSARLYPHLDSIAKDGWSGMLAFREGVDRHKKRC